MRQNCTDTFLRFREIARSAWNLGIWPEPALRDFGPVMRYEEAMVRLFEAMVWNLDTEDRVEPGKPVGSIGCFTVEVKAGDTARLMVDRSQPGQPVHVWGDPLCDVVRSSCVLRFLAFFDWYQLAPLDFRLLRVAIESMPGRPELVGREALIEFDKCEIWVSGNQSSG